MTAALKYKRRRKPLFNPEPGDRVTLVFSAGLKGGVTYTSAVVRSVMKLRRNKGMVISAMVQVGKEWHWVHRENMRPLRG